MHELTCASKSTDNNLSLAELETRVNDDLPPLPDIVTRLVALNRDMDDYSDRVLTEVRPILGIQLN